MITMETKQDGEVQTLHRWNCSKCNMRGVWLCHAEVSQRNGDAHYVARHQDSDTDR